MNFKDLKFKQINTPKGKPPCSEANITDEFLDLPKNDYLEEFKVTVRKYPKSYVIAFTLYWHDEGDSDDWDYTSDGNGDGIIPSLIHASGSSQFVKWHTYPHDEFEFFFDQIMSALRRDLAQVVQYGEYKL